VGYRPGGWPILDPQKPLGWPILAGFARVGPPFASLFSPVTNFDQSHSAAGSFRHASQSRNLTATGGWVRVELVSP